MLAVNEISSLTQLAAIRTEWDALLETSSQSVPFLMYEWFQCCLDGYGQGKEIFVLCVKEGTELVGIAPLWRYKDTIREIPVTKIGFITNPDTPSVDCIIRTDKRETVLKTLLSYLYTSRKTAWDILALDHWSAESPNQEGFRAALEEQERPFIARVTARVPYVSIQTEWEAFLQTRSVRFRKTHRNVVNRMKKLNNVEVVRMHYDPDGSAFQSMLAVSERSWKHRAQIALSNREETKRFFALLTHVAGKKKWLCLWLLKIDGSPVAMEYDLEHQGRVYALRADFDEMYKEYSPGVYLEYSAIKYFFENGYREYNTGPGMNTYKLHWTEDVRENVLLQAYNSNFKGFIAWRLERTILPVLRRVRDLMVQIRLRKGE